MPHVKKWVKTRERQDGTTVSTTVHQAVWREHANGADRTKEFRRKGDAERFLVDVQHRLMTGAYTDPVLGRTPFCEVAERYLSLGVWKPKIRQTATEKLRYAIDKFGDRPIASIRKGDVQALISELGDVLAPSTIRIVRQHVGATFTRAIDDKLIVANPAVGVRLPRVETPSVVPLTAEQVQLLLDAADPWYRGAIVIGAGLGLRSSEAAGLNGRSDRLPPAHHPRRPPVATGDAEVRRRVHDHQDEGKQPSDPDQPVGPRRDRCTPRTAAGRRARRDRDP